MAARIGRLGAVHPLLRASDPAAAMKAAETVDRTFDNLAAFPRSGVPIEGADAR